MKKVILAAVVVAASVTAYAVSLDFTQYSAVEIGEVVTEVTPDGTTTEVYGY